MTAREVGAGERLANPVRSGRKQPQRAPLGSMSSLSPPPLPARQAPNAPGPQTPRACQPALVGPRLVAAPAGLRHIVKARHSEIARDFELQIKPGDGGGPKAIGSLLQKPRPAGRCRPTIRTPHRPRGAAGRGDQRRAPAPSALKDRHAVKRGPPAAPGLPPPSSPKIASPGKSAAISARIRVSTALSASVRQSCGPLNV